MNTGSRPTRLLAVLAALVIAVSLSGPALATDDGARAYRNAREGTQVVSFQFLNLAIDASDSVQFAPDQFIYPNADIEASIFIASWARHFVLFNRQSSLAVTIVGGDIDADINIATAPPEFLPPGITPEGTFSQSASGYADPAVQLTMNLFGTPPLSLPCRDLG